MKTILILALLSLASLAYTQAPTETEKVVVDSTKRDSLPAQLCTVIDGDSICLPTNDAEAAANVIEEFVEENRGNFPKSLTGWAVLILAFLFSARGTVLITSARNIYNFLKIFLRNTLNIVAFVSGVFATGITFLLGSGEFETQTFLTLWGIFAFASVYVWENFVKPKRAKKVRA